MQHKKHKPSTRATEAYNTLLDLNWELPQITITHIRKASSLRGSQLTLALEELDTLGLLLTGLEDSLEGLIQTYTPIVKGGAYEYPYDDFKHDEWLEFKLK